MDSNNNNNNNRVRSFERFFREWLIRQEQYLGELEHEIESSSNGIAADGEERRQKELITRILEHYRMYYAAKARIAREDVFLLFCPPLVDLILAVLPLAGWLAGWRPGLAFQMVSNLVFDLTEDQSRRINVQMDEIKREVQELTDILARVQRGMAASATAAVAHEHLGQVQNGEQVHLQYSSVDRFPVSMEALVESADYLRGRTSQALRFLASGAQFHLSLRRYGQRGYPWCSPPKHKH